MMHESVDLFARLEHDSQCAISAKIYVWKTQSVGGEECESVPCKIGTN